MVLVPTWSTRYGIDPNLDYSIWYWPRPGVLTLVILYNPVVPEVLDWVSRVFL